jgi:hypothetical protein
MERITSSTRIPNKWGPGRDGFGDGNPTAGTPSTQLNMGWFDNLQEEVARVIEIAGITLDGAEKEQLNEAIDRKIAGAGLGFVLRTGDTMTGPLISPTLTANVVNFTNPATSFAAYTVGNLSIRAYTAQAFWSFDQAGAGSLIWQTSAPIAAGAVTLAPGGGINTTGPIQGGAAITAVGNVSGANVTAVTGNVAAAGSVTASVEVTAVGAIRAGQYVYAGSPAISDFYMGFNSANGNRSFSFRGDTANFEWTSGDGSVALTAGFSAVGFTQWISDGVSGDFLIKGDFGQLSDARLKNITGDYTSGLAQIIQVNPKVYTLVNDETGREQYGLIAQDVQKCLPECVLPVPEIWRFGQEQLDGALGLSIMPLIATLINAFKEVNMRLEALERRRALEGR